jgi:uncharacterized Tic20 family protein
MAEDEKPKRTTKKKAPAKKSAPPPEPPAPPEAPETPPPPPPGGPEPIQEELRTENVTPDERTWGMLCHLLALAGFFVPFGNVFGPLVIWLVKRADSRYVDYHGRQSMWFQIFGMIIVTVLTVISLPLTAVCVGFLGLLIAMGVWLAQLIYALVASIQVSGGKDFDYPWVGPWVRKSLP